MLKQGLSQKMLQRMSPQQIQLMKLLQVPTAQLEQRIKEELEANPALEEGESAEADDTEESALEEAQPAEEEREEPETSKDEDLDLSDYMDDDEVADYKLQDNNYPDPDEEKTIPISEEKSFHEYLLDQLSTLDLDESQEKIAEQLIGSIDEDGYLRREISSIVDDLSFSQNVAATESEILDVLRKVQELDPPGIGARDLRECLLLQLDRLKGHEVYVRLAKKILADHYEHFTKKHYDKLQKMLEIPEEHLKGGLDIILHLNPKPGSAATEGGNKSRQYITPDYFITNNNGELQLTLNGRNAPELRVSREFKDMIQDYSKTKEKTKEQKEAVMFIKQKIDGAKWFIDAIRQRQQTLLGTMQTMMEYQYDFFLTGDETKLKPMILKDIAEKTGQDISTVSRVSNSKYVQTEFGVYPLKYFFSESISTDEGEEVSTREVKKILSDMIAIEDKKKPLSDQYLTKMLNQKGYNIARRTVAKYREQLDIPVARLRKEL